eukprot:gene11746-14357_t
MSQIRAHAISYEVDGQVFEGQLVYDPNVEDPRPALLMVPIWFGITDSAIDTARQVAEERRVVLVVDLYGAGVRPADANEAGAAMAPLKADRQLLRRRMVAALQALREQHAVNIDPARQAAFGFCVGGTCALELARAGTLVGAARRLAVDHTTVARRLQALEKQVGSALFAREAGGHRLTEAGRAQLPQVEANEAAFL